MSGLTYEHLNSEPVFWCVRAGHPSAYLDNAQMRGLVRFQVILPTHDTIIRDKME